MRAIRRETGVGITAADDSDASLDRSCGAGPGGASVILDRRRAIEEAISGARPGDSILIAGKGHETWQVVGSERIAFDVSTEALDRT